MPAMTYIGFEITMQMQESRWHANAQSKTVVTSMMKSITLPNFPVGKQGCAA